MGIAGLVLKGEGKWIRTVFRLRPVESYFHLSKSWQVDMSDLLV